MDGRNHEHSSHIVYEVSRQYARQPTSRQGGGPPSTAVERPRPSCVLGHRGRHLPDEITIAGDKSVSAYETGRRQPTLPTLLRMLASAGWELRLGLAERDNHDEVLAEWERSLSEETRDRLRRQGYRLVSGAA
jgi:hypothetical protein